MRPRHHATQLEIVTHAKLGKEVAPLRHVADTELEQLPRLQTSNVRAVEEDFSALHR